MNYYNVRALLTLLLLVSLAGIVPANAQVAFTVGGQTASSGGLSGLAPGKTVILVNNGGDSLPLGTNGDFTFPTPLASGSSYSVTIAVQPGGQVCAVTNGSGILNANVTNVGINCVSTYTVGGSITGLAVSGLVLKLNNSTTKIIASGAGGYVFSTALPAGTNYTVSVGIQPAGYSCTLINGTGTISGAVTNANVSCSRTYTVGGTISGLTTSGLILKLNGSGSKIISGSASSYVFSTALISGTSYAVTIQNQPSGLICLVLNASGTIGLANVVDANVFCAPITYTVGGSVAGLGSGKSVTLLNNSSDALSISANGQFNFAAALPNASTYNVTVSAQPTAQFCSVTNGAGSIAGANVTGISVVCVTAYSVGGTISGLTVPGLELLLNGASTQTITVGASSFTFSNGLPTGAAYVVSVGSQPSGQVCSVTNGAGNISNTAVTSVLVLCKASYSLVNGDIGMVSDPLVSQQWHLLNTGQTGYSDISGIAGSDINANPVYKSYGFGGKGVTVAVVDSGLEIAHEDLAANVVPGGSWNFINNTTDPTNTVDTTGDHGTSVAGLIAMARNAVGGIGVASEAKLKSFNYLSTQTTANRIASLGGSSSNPTSNDVFIFNQSFGSYNTSDTVISSTVEAQYASGVTNLRAGKGAVYVKASGNGFNAYGTADCSAANNLALSCDNSNFDPYNTIPYQIVAGAVDASGSSSYYSTAGSSLWVSAPGGEYGFNASVAPGYLGVAYQPAMVTTDQSGCTNGYARNTAASSTFNLGGANNSGENAECNYTNTFNGTSSATPVVSGVVALILEANPALTWRDVKYILAKTSVKAEPNLPAKFISLSNGSYEVVPAWKTNAAGFKYHNRYGFGVVDAKAAVDLARNYSSGQLGAFANTGWIASSNMSLAIPDNSVTGVNSSLNVSVPAVGVVEAVQIRVSATHPNTGDLAIELVSPSGTRSVLKTGADGFTSNANLSNMVLLSNAFYGEPAAGAWTIRLVDVASGNTGTFTRWSVRIYGH
jgi:subtilisin-like proprotein convertase family protein